MDTSKEYIKMCRKAEEIQEIWDKISPIYNEKDFMIWDRLLTPKRLTWLPRQDQLQEMMLDEKEPDLDFWYWNEIMGEWANDGFPILYYKIKIASMEQLWLAFVMKEKYNKVWDGELWK